MKPTVGTTYLHPFEGLVTVTAEPVNGMVEIRVASDGALVHSPVDQLHYPSACEHCGGEDCDGTGRDSIHPKGGAR